MKTPQLASGSTQKGVIATDAGSYWREPAAHSHAPAWERGISPDPASLGSCVLSRHSHAGARILAGLSYAQLAIPTRERGNERNP